MLISNQAANFQKLFVKANSLSIFAQVVTKNPLAVVASALISLFASSFTCKSKQSIVF